MLPYNPRSPNRPRPGGVARRVRRWAKARHPLPGSKPWWARAPTARDDRLLQPSRAPMRSRTHGHAQWIRNAQPSSYVLSEHHLLPRQAVTAGASIEPRYRQAAPLAATSPACRNAMGGASCFPHLGVVFFAPLWAQKSEHQIRGCAWHGTEAGGESPLWRKYRETTIRRQGLPREGGRLEVLAGC